MAVILQTYLQHTLFNLYYSMCCRLKLASILWHHICTRSLSHGI